MKPLGQKPIRLPGKTSQWYGKGIKMWWEELAFCNKKADRQKAKQEIIKELTNGN